MRVTAYQCPYRHWMIDDLLDGRWLAAALRQVPDADWDGWVRYDNDCERGKRTCSDPNRLPEGVRFLLAQLTHSWPCRDYFREWSGVHELESDTSLYGGGLQVLDPGGWLQVHADLELQPLRADWERRLNLILSLNPGWDELWGGALVLCDPQGRPVVRHYPAWNRAVLFECGPDSLHGVQRTSPDAPPRVTLMASYLAPARPGAHRLRAMFLPNRQSPDCPAEVA